MLSLDNFPEKKNYASNVIHATQLIKYATQWTNFAHCIHTLVEWAMHGTKKQRKNPRIILLLEWKMKNYARTFVQKPHWILWTQWTSGLVKRYSRYAPAYVSLSVSYYIFCFCCVFNLERISVRVGICTAVLVCMQHTCVDVRHVLSCPRWMCE